ncbi:MAG: hypothetical protein SGARI_007261, partial [Bacillariaceae sp.]
RICASTFGSSSKNNGASLSKSLVRYPDISKTPGLDEAQRQRILQIQELLCDRHEYVMDGDRMRDFSNWISEQGGEAKIFSMHGVDVNFEPDEFQNMEMSVEIYPMSSRDMKSNKDPFLADRMNLNIPVTSSSKAVAKSVEGCTDC